MVVAICSLTWHLLTSKVLESTFLSIAPSFAKHFLRSIAHISIVDVGLSEYSIIGGFSVTDGGYWYKRNALHGKLDLKSFTEYPIRLNYK